MAEAGSQIIKGFLFLFLFWDNFLSSGCHLMLNCFYHAHHYHKNKNFERKKMLVHNTK
jgi:hypothetical protein